jgi:excisionase family DNA binding protein
MEAVMRRALGIPDRSLPEEMTITQAADFLDVQRPDLTKLVKRGELPCRMEGKRRRIPIAALLDYREWMFHRAKAALAELTQRSQELGLYELEGPPPRA